VVRFVVLFLLFILLFAALSATARAEQLLHAPLARLTAVLVGQILSPLGSASASGNSIWFNSFSASVDDACDGVLPLSIFIAAVLAFPSRWRSKAWGILLGTISIFLINLLRVATLMVVGSRWPDLFEQVHIYVWQALVIALSMGVWVLWVEAFVRPGAPARR
jgi:exosortase H (IPTLxxWG-CTERM-specific)